MMLVESGFVKASKASLDVFMSMLFVFFTSASLRHLW